MESMSSPGAADPNGAPAARPVSAPDLAPPSDPGSAALAALLDCGADAAALDRAALALATHDDGAGFTQAWLMLWNPRRRLLEFGRHERSVAPATTLAAALQRARHEPASNDASQAYAAGPESLGDTLAHAWTTSASAVGTAAANPAAPWNGCGELGAIALRLGSGPYGLLVGAWSEAADPEARAERLESLRALLNAAYAAHERANESKRRAMHGAALAELARGVVSSLNLAEALHLGVRLASQGCEARGAALWRILPGGALRLEVTHGDTDERERFARLLAPLAERTCAELRIESLEAAALDSQLAGEGAGDLTAVAALPLVAYAQPLGVLVLYDRQGRHATECTAFDRADLEFLGTMADAIASVLEQSQAADERRRLEQQARQLTAQLQRQERLANLGERATQMAHESRNPLASIGAFAKRAHRALADNDPQREYLEIVIRESERLEALMREQLEYAALDRPRLKLESLNAVVQTALQQASETLVRRRVRLIKRLAPDLPSLLLDAERVQRVIENVLRFALEAVPLGGRIKVESRRAGPYAIVELAHDGARAGGDLLEQLFVPFASNRAGGGGLGLGVAQQIVREHGGEIRVRSEGEWGTVFSFTLPVRENQDRRGRDPDRRGTSRERRRRHPEA